MKNDRWHEGQEELANLLVEQFIRQLKQNGYNMEDLHFTLILNKENAEGDKIRLGFSYESDDKVKIISPRGI